MHYHPIKCLSFHHFNGSTQAPWSLSLIISIPESWNGIASRLIELRSSVVSVLRSLIASRGTTCPSHDQTTFCQSTGSLDDLSSCQSWVGPVLHYLRNRLASPLGEIYIYITNHSNAHVIEKTLATVARHSGFSSVHEWIFRLLLKISVDRSNYNES